MSTSDLPALNATFNSLSTLFILSGLFAIRRGRWKAHAGFMISALVTSAAFLTGYLIHKAYHGTTTSEHMGHFRPVYLTLLLSHTVLAVANLPLLILTVTAAARRHWNGHRRWAKRTFPVWLYVSATGVLVYFILYHWFPVPAAS
jgi:putative membrane protein